MSTNAPITEADGWFLGEDKQFQFTIASAAGGVQNITGWTIQFALADVFSGVSDLTKTATITDGPAGICTVSILSADTLTLPPTSDTVTYYYRLRRTDAGARTELSYGTAELLDVFVD